MFRQLVKQHHRAIASLVVVLSSLLLWTHPSWLRLTPTSTSEKAPPINLNQLTPYPGLAIPSPTSSPITLALTGVTAISRGVEASIERHNDAIYPARGVMQLLRTASITVVDSENPFFNDCLPAREGLVLCGKTRSLAALKAIGADLIDLTGNHQNDYGPEKNLESIGHLQANNFKYFGGGKNEADASKILYQQVNQTTFAFLGYAYFDSLNGASYKSLAFKDRPGANFYSEAKMRADVAKAKQKADFVIVDYQFTEEYSYHPLPAQRRVFRQTIEAGADIVVGVQSHQPQQIEIYQNGLIFYGLGNFFFDQMWSKPTRQGIIPWLTFQNGKLSRVQLYTTLLHDYAQPQLTVNQERISLLKEILPPTCQAEKWLKMQNNQPPNILPCLQASRAG